MTRRLEAPTTKCVHVHVAKEVGRCNFCHTLDTLVRSNSCRLSIWDFFFVLNHVKADCGFFEMWWYVQYRSDSWLKSEPQVTMLSLLEEIDLLSLSGSYESAARHRILLPFTGAAHWQADDDSRAEPSQGVRMYVSIMCTRERVCVFPRTEDRNLSMAAEIVGIPRIPLDSKQPVTSQEGERGFLPKLSTLQQAQVQYFPR